MNQKEKRRLSNQYNRAHPMANGHIEPEENLEGYDADDWLKFLHEHKMVAAQALVNQVRRGNSAEANKLFWKVIGALIEKQEIDVKITAADRIRAAREIAEESQRRLRDGSPEDDGGSEVLGESEILHDGVCLDNRQEHSQDNQVEAVGLPPQDS